MDQKLLFSYLFDMLKASLISVLICLQKLVLWPFKKKKNISGQLALITGGGKGLGRELCLILAKQGCNIAVVDIDLKSANETVNQCKALGVKAKAYKTDISDVTAVELLRNKVLWDLGTVDILVNNAGILFIQPFVNETPENIANMVNVNFMGTIWVTRAFLPSMARKQRGHIVTISSMAAYAPVAGDVIYSATKYGLRGFMDALDEDIYLQGLNECIYSTTIFPHFICTNENIKDRVNTLLQYKFLLHPKYVAKVTLDSILYNKTSVMIPRAFESQFYINFPRYFRKTFLRYNFKVTKAIMWDLSYQDDILNQSTTSP